jgi:hypothetical protein
MLQEQIERFVILEWNGESNMLWLAREAGELSQRRRRLNSTRIQRETQAVYLFWTWIVMRSQMQISLVLSCPLSVVE